MTYLDKYPNCNGCPVEKYCGTAVSCVKLCQSLSDSMESVATGKYKYSCKSA